MSSPSAKKPISGPTNGTPSSRNHGDKSPNRPAIGSAVPASTGQGLARTPSLRQTRLARKPTSRTSSTFVAPDSEQEDEETKSANAQLISGLKEQVDRAEQASEQYRKQLEIMQRRLDEAAAEQTTGEERDYKRQTEIDRLRAEIRDSARERRELESTHEHERKLFEQERERQSSRELELQDKVHRLTETLRTKGLERSSVDRVASLPENENEVDDESGAAGTSSSSAMVQALRQKDAAIESLRLELAETQLKVAEQEQLGDGQVQGLEKAIMEIKMQNARLIEENESFQVLLSEKTLKGDFLRDHSGEMAGMSSLADELAGTGEDTEGQTDPDRRLEAEVRALREENKALTLYVDKIVGRILQHEGFEHIITGRENLPEPPSKQTPSEKALPAIPDHQAAPAAAATTATGVASGFLQRARSVVSRPGGRGRPMSYAQPTASTPMVPSANENPETAPSIPMGRSRHRRARSDQAQTDLGAAAVVHQMNRGSPMRTVSGNPLSPGIRPLSPQQSQNRQSYFGTSSARAVSGSGGTGGSSTNSVNSEHSEEQRSTTEVSSTGPGSSQGQGQGQGSIPGAVIKQNQLRPLRLVQEQTAEEEAQKRANRGSWMGWLRGGSIEAQND
ncbi:hypothetical protein PV10_07800 [Exophiala mesophila]|uniref:M protein, serotype 2.1 n=1 Tax=Exophiala mesophila TaxID=212818 RepID=A0A0D1XR10_EXOME|nr:uncharacterized protein PV10_07800 [Exophiala mesophila]KIV90501.1 hypothetical protein PV10_07800 [Exophiala mesophila]